MGVLGAPCRLSPGGGCSSHHRHLLEGLGLDSLSSLGNEGLASWCSATPTHPCRRAEPKLRSTTAWQGTGSSQNSGFKPQLSPLLWVSQGGTQLHRAPTSSSLEQ